MALAQLLAPGSTIQAIDLDQSALDEIPQRIDGVEIRKVIGDLQNPNLVLPSVDGILMANSLHFIRNQHDFLNRLLSLTGTNDLCRLPGGHTLLALRGCERSSKTWEWNVWRSWRHDHRDLAAQCTPP